MWTASAPVVVGVDGSDAAIDAKWAIDEAISRDVPLRIVHVTHIEGQPAAPDDHFRLDVQYAESSLRAAAAAVEATGNPSRSKPKSCGVSPDTALINESRNAAMVCVGSVGIGAVASKMWGSTAASLAEKAYCPVAIIRSPHTVPASEPDWIVVAVQGHAKDESVIEHAMNEARLRTAPAFQSESGKKTSAKLLTTNWTGGSKSGSSVTRTCASIRWPPGPASLDSWPTTRTNRCS